MTKSQRTELEKELNLSLKDHNRARAMLLVHKNKVYSWSREEWIPHNKKDKYDCLLMREARILQILLGKGKIQAAMRPHGKMLLKTFSIYNDPEIEPFGPNRPFTPMD